MKYHIFILFASICCTFSKKYDYVVVGGGTAGCVVASRLSEDPDVNILLLDAGPSDRDSLDISVPGLFFTLGRFDWNYFSEPLKKAAQIIPDKRVRLPIAKMLGGCSSHNGLVMVRGNPADYNRWRDLGNTGWGYDDVLPYFKKMEDMKVPELIDNGFHGAGGPISVAHAKDSYLVDTFLSAGVEMGFNITDHNSDQQIGFSKVQLSRRNGRRASTSEAYIWPIIGRRNLKLILNAYAYKVVFKNDNAIGVLYKKGNTSYKVRAKREVIISAGALNSPKLLMQSGIGPKQHLRKMEIPIVKNLPVGNEVIDHAFILLEYGINDSISKLPSELRSFQNLLEFIKHGTGYFAEPGVFGLAFTKAKSQMKNDTYPFLQIENVDNIFTSAKEHHGFTTFLLHLHQRTKGRLRLRDKNYFSAPRVWLKLLENQQDADDLVEGIRFIRSMGNTAAFQSIGTKDLFPPLKQCSHFEYDTDPYWRCYIAQRTSTGYHYMGTCKMSPDKTGVVDYNLRVKGIKNLRVADASIIPSSVSGNTMVPAIMIGEKAADIIKNYWMKKK